MKVDKNKLTVLVSNQLKNLFGVDSDLFDYQDETLKRVAHCFECCNNKYYNSGTQTNFSPFHSVQYSIYLYYLANTIYRSHGTNELSDQLYYLNKVINSVDWYYEISLPKIFCAEHPLGSVMGRAKYSDKFFFYQGCTVGGNKGVYPVFGENVTMYSNSTIIGDSKIGENVIISTGSIIKDEIIPSNCLVFGQSPNLIVKVKTESEIEDLTKQFWK